MKKLLPRNKVKPADTWDLASLFSDDDAWETAFTAWEKHLAGYAEFQGCLGESPERLAACLRFDESIDHDGERIGVYASLKVAEDTADSRYQRMQGRYINAAGRAAEAACYIRPEILAIPNARMKQFLEAPALKPFRLLLARLLESKPHTLGKKEERLLAMQTEMSQAAGQVFRQLNDADLKFGMIRNDAGESIELSHATFSVLLHSPKRAVRRAAFEQYYSHYDAMQHTLAAAMAGSVQRDVYYARARNHESSLHAALFPDRVPTSVYDNLIASIHRHLPAVHHYYDVRRRKMRLRDIHFYDTYVPILSDLQTRHTWSQAVETVLSALAPLGDEYCGLLRAGLAGRWCDRYENRGKQSGAFSSGTYDGAPYILMNYQPDVLDHVFTLAHEGGHSMHTLFSARSQPFLYYNYTIFVAEVASTFNEEMLSRHLMAQAKDDRQRAFLVNREIDAMRATIVRQTMFAEFEQKIHASAEAGEPLTIDRFRSIYRELLTQYFGPDFVLDDVLSLEGLRIPHFYHAFYVYKYATGMSAAMALVDRVLSGGQKELDDYLNFLRGGCSLEPLELLRGAGVDMEQPTAIDAAMTRFGELVEELDRLV